MLRNFGFEVIDLGRNVPMPKILDAAIEHNAEVIGLSALMTTTMLEMKTVIEEVKKEGFPTRSWLAVPRLLGSLPRRFMQTAMEKT